MNNKLEHDISSGDVFVSLSAEKLKGRTIITAFSSGISIRSHLLHVPCVLESFESSLFAVLGLEENHAEDKAECLRISNEFNTFLGDVLHN